MKIHITGASGSGTTTLGRKISDELIITHFDTDDIFWEPSNPPYQYPRDKEERKKRLRNVLNSEKKWVLSGSLCGWGDFAIPLFDLVIFLWVPTEVRINRLKARELEKFGQKSLSPGGEMHENHKEFIAWASQYDTGNHEMRSLAMHETWLNTIDCEVIRYEGVVTTNTIMHNVTKRFTGTR